MYTARDVALRLRHELNDPRIGVKFMPDLERWVVFVRRPMLTGARTWPMAILDDGSLAPGQSTIQSVSYIEDIVWVVTDEHDQYHPLEPNLIRRKLIERDTHRRDHAKELFAELRRRRLARKKAVDEEVRARTRYYRRAFAKIAEDMGLGGRPDYQQVYSPTRISPA
jgi:hypothetical protein